MMRTIYWVDSKLGMRTADVPADAVTVDVHAPCPKHPKRRIEAIDWLRGRSHHAACTQPLPRLVLSTSNGDAVVLDRVAHTKTVYPGREA